MDGTFVILADGSGVFIMWENGEYTEHSDLVIAIEYWLGSRDSRMFNKLITVEEN